jgi:hypothetical protein
MPVLDTLAQLYGLHDPARYAHMLRPGAFGTTHPLQRATASALRPAREQAVLAPVLAAAPRSTARHTRQEGSGATISLVHDFRHAPALRARICAVGARVYVGRRTREWEL